MLFDHILLSCYFMRTFYLSDFYFYFLVVYADYISSGRSLQFLEDYINKEVLPAYGDINTTSSVTGLQSLLY